MRIFVNNKKDVANEITRYMECDDILLFAYARCDIAFFNFQSYNDKGVCG